MSDDVLMAMNDFGVGMTSGAFYRVQQGFDRNGGKGLPV